MLGEKIIDKNHVENDNIEEINGLGLLKMTTTFCEEKKTEQVKGTIKNVVGLLSTLNGLEYVGYEIHMGKSSGEINDIISCHDNIYGTYIHGIFDNSEIGKIIIKTIAEKKHLNIDDINKFDYQKYKEEQYDILASAVRKALDMDKIYQILELK